MEWTKNYKKAITFSYDDGVESDLRLLESLNKYNLKATFNVNTGLDEKSDSWVYKDFEVKRLNLTQNINAYEGHEIAVHTLTHPGMCELTDAELEREVLGDKENIQKLFNQCPIGMAYPYGAYSERFLSMETDKPQIFYIWGHSYEFDGNHNWDRMEEFCKLISGKENIFYGTNREVLI